MLVRVPVDLASLVRDLSAEQAALRAILVDIDRPSWEAATPAPGWTVLHQVRHLAHGEGLGHLAATDAAGFAAELERLLADLDAAERAITSPTIDDPPQGALDRWWTHAERLRVAIAAGPIDEPIAWITGPMSRASFVSARLMETFAHGHDIAAGLGVDVVPTTRLRHVAHLGVATRAFSFAIRGMEVPTTAVRVELDGPGNDIWTWGPEDAPDVVRGPALDFCLLVTKRRHRDDTRLVASGPSAGAWLTIAQCFAGPPTDGPPSAAQ